MGTKETVTLLDALRESLKRALRSAEGTAEPVALLWTDADGQWRSLIPKLRPELSQLYSLGRFDRSTRSGPVIWLKCVVGRAVAEDAPPPGTVPILYLPGVSRQELRASGDCRAELQPLIELQFRGKVWHQANGRDWTVEAFLSSGDGLGLDIAQDARTRDALLRALPVLAETPVEGLRGRHLEADDFDKLTVPDIVRDLLRWMSDPEGFEKSCQPAGWQSFRNICKQEFGLDPENDGAAAAASALMQGGGRWDDVWTRFCEAPRVYAGVSRLLREPMAGQGLLALDPSRRPIVNDEAEERLRRELEQVANQPHAQACERVLELEKEHGPRRQWVWAQLGESPYAMALASLARLAGLAQSPLGGPSVEAMAEGYASQGWRCDRAAMEALSSAKGAREANVVTWVVRVLYAPWLDACTRHFQEVMSGYAGGASIPVPVVKGEKEICVLFVDGLRFDLGGILQEKLEGRSLRVHLNHRLAPVPTVTATAKPCATPISDCIRKDSPGDEFTPMFRESGQPASTPRLREEMQKSGVEVVETDEAGNPSTSPLGSWTETARLDELGHKLGSELAAQIDSQLERIADRVFELLESGWRKVRVVTDHGWLLMPGGLPKVELPAYLVATRWARCASITAEGSPNLPTYPWYWNPQIRIACPPWIGSFFAGSEYAHGGVSFQECVVPELSVERGEAGLEAVIQSVQWRGMRCRVSVRSNEPGVRADLRLNWKQPATSIVAEVKSIGPAGEASLAVKDDRHEGAAAMVVLLDPSGKVLDRRSTSVGEGR